MTTLHIAADPETKAMLQECLQQLASLSKKQEKLETLLKYQAEKDTELNAKQVATLIGYQYHYFQSRVRHTKGFPKPIKGTDGKNQHAKWWKSDIDDYRNTNKGQPA